MQYPLEEILYRLGVSQDVCFEKPARWRYANPEIGGQSGFAEVRMDPGNNLLTVELRHWKNTGDTLEDRQVETLFLEAVRVQQSDMFAVTVMILDGEPYEVFDESLLDLCLSVFRSRAIEINMKMIEQRFHERASGIAEVLDALPETDDNQDNQPRHTAQIIPFRPRENAPLQRF